ncbi:hypothetical protein LCGC14_1970310 [marine sediment metagenome]|uniref:Uncharacterized protein n=1 Tax=marine sediment metagenome TaxID=412755 RepID=A0A0F9FC09_9ZZZZ
MFQVIDESRDGPVFETEELAVAKDLVRQRPGSYYIFDTESEVDIFTEDGGMTWETTGADSGYQERLAQQPEDRTAECPSSHGPGICRLCEG